MTEPLPAFIYAPSHGAWIEDRHASPPALPSSAISVITWNTWFAPYSFDARFKALLALIHARRPDVICLQEIVAESLEMLLATPWIRAEYRISDARGTTFESYGVVLLSRLPVLSLAIHELPSSMHRRLLVAEIAVGPRRLVVATAHLESMKPNRDTRADQLAEIFPRLKAMGPDAVLVGDFNLCSSWTEENANLDPEFVDLWPALRDRAPGYTEDTGVNTMLLNVKNKEKTVRFDRILLRSAEGAWKPGSIELLGTAPIAPTSPDVFPSDHFGLIAVIEAR
jgi:tyrosyl-DNA phosphodiesterase 2